jgi:DNA-binding NarL/FixJ family response regulator
VLRIVLGEDAVLLREGLVGILAQGGHEVVAAVDDLPTLLAAAREHRPDVVVTDVRMPPGHTDEGMRAALTLRQERPGLPVVVLSQYIAHAYAERLLASSADGGVGYLLKDRVGQVSEFVTAVEQVAAGGCVIDPEVVRQLLARRRDPLERLTVREREVLALMAEGKANAAIAAALVVSEAAIAKHINSIFAKLGLDASGKDHRRVQAVLTFLRS